MAKSAAEKKAYAKEYYDEYVKKGKKKGRKKGKKAKTKTKTSNASLLGGSSTSGLNSDGMIEASLIKEKAKAAMNSELNSAKTDEERDNIRRKYSQIANAQIEKLKTDSKYAKPKTTKATKSSKGTKTAKSSSSNKSSAKSSAESSSKNTGSNKTTASTATSTNSAKTNNATASASLDVNTASLDAIRDFVSNIDEIYSKMSQMTPEQKTEVRTVIQDMIDLLKKRLSNG